MVLFVLTFTSVPETCKTHASKPIFTQGNQVGMSSLHKARNNPVNYVIFRCLPVESLDCNNSYIGSYNNKNTQGMLSHPLQNKCPVSVTVYINQQVQSTKRDSCCSRSNQHITDCIERFIHRDACKGEK
uniref:Heparan-alpha-glucosaminide N-acetyltransferase-like n=2 Tax=Rhizophora mucronata TaxID=61149 RepID=A0A2P2M3W2_RHIMU